MTASIPVMQQMWKKDFATHNRGKGAKYTTWSLPVKLLYQEAF